MSRYFRQKTIIIFLIKNTGGSKLITAARIRFDINIILFIFEAKDLAYRNTVSDIRHPKH